MTGELRWLSLAVARTMVPSSRRLASVFSMGITGREVAKDVSDIVLLDDSFASIVKAINWGHCVNDALGVLPSESMKLTIS